VLEVAIFEEAFALPKDVEASGATATCNKNFDIQDTRSKLFLVEPGHVKSAACRSRLGQV
jgi:hypothetical protein